MATIKVHKSSDYTTICNVHLREKQMSLKAKGLLTTMLSLHEDWKYSVAGLCSILLEKETAVEAALKELKKFGYLIVTKKYSHETVSGRFEYVYDIYEKPQIPGGDFPPLEIPPLEIPPLEIPPLENHPLYINTNKSSRKVSKKKEITSGVCAGARTREIEHPRESYQEVMDNNGVSWMLQPWLWKFIQHCQLNGKMLTNSKLLDIITRLDFEFRRDEDAKCTSVSNAISGGYFDIKE